jgi:HK97 family phage major capsid protein
MTTTITTTMNKNTPPATPATPAGAPDAHELVKVDNGYRAASMMPASLDTDKRTVEVTFGTEALVLRYDWRSDKYFWEQLGYKSGEVRMERLTSGAAPVLDNHNSYGGAKSSLGVVDSAKLNGKSGTAVLRFSKRADVEPIYQDVLDGIIRTVSVGYRVNEYRDTGKTGEKGYPIYRAVDWEPMEISLAPIAADPQSRVRNEATEHYEVRLQRDATEAPAPVTLPATTPQPPKNEIPQRNAASTNPKKSKAMDVNELKSLRATKMKELAALDTLSRSASGVSDEDKVRLDALTNEVAGIDDQITAAEKRAALLVAHAAAGAGGAAPEHVEKRKMVGRASITEQVLRIADGKPLDGVVAEMTQDAQARGLTEGNGISIPTDFIEALRSGTADNFQIDAGQGSAFKPTEVPSFIEKMFAPYVFERLGATRLTGLIGKQQFPRQKTHGASTARTEVQAALAAGLELDDLTMDARRYPAKTQYSKKLLVQSPLAFDSIIANAFRRSFERQIEFDGFLGATGGANIVGIFNQTGVNDITPADLTNYNAIAAALYKASIAGEANVDMSNWVLSPRTWELLQAAAQVTGVSPLLSAGGTMHGRPTVTSPYLLDNTNQGRLLFGDFSHAIFGYWGSFDLVVDPYTLAETNQIKLVGQMYVDLGLSQPLAFSKCDEVGNT